MSETRFDTAVTNVADVHHLYVEWDIDWLKSGTITFYRSESDADAGVKPELVVLAEFHYDAPDGRELSESEWAYDPQYEDLDPARVTITDPDGLKHELKTSDYQGTLDLFASIIATHVPRP